MAQIHEEGNAAHVPFHVVATWPETTFLENIAISEKTGDLYVTSHSTQQILRFKAADAATASADKEATPIEFLKLEIPVAGIVFDKQGHLWFNAGHAGVAGHGSIWRVDPEDASKLTKWLDVPEALLLNGQALHPLKERHILVAESFLGRIYEVSLDEPKISIWLESDKLLPHRTGKLPGVNGIKIWGNHIYVTNTDDCIIYRIKVQADGTAGDIEVFAESLRGDDFAFCTNGNLWITTHIFNSLAKLTPDGVRTVIAGPEQGMAGSSACAFGRTDLDKSSLYVTTEGGIYNPHNGKLQRAKLIRLDVGSQGASLV